MSTSVILITGCSSGFGRELALAALSAGLHVIATARRPETIAFLEEKGAKALRLDVNAAKDELDSFAEQALSAFGHIDYLINNAGFLQGGAIEENNQEEILAQFNTNFFAVINITSLFLPHFRQRKQGTIVNISSQGAAMGIPGAGIYCASKAAVDAISETWAQELENFNIRCVSIQAGAFRTSVAGSDNLKIAAKKIDGYDGAHEWVVNFNRASGSERGDTAKAAFKIIELISVEPTPQLPSRLALGEDAYENIKACYSKHMEDMEKWKSVSTGTDVVGD